MPLCRHLSKIPHSQLELSFLRLNQRPISLRYASTDLARNEHIRKTRCTEVYVVNPSGGLSRKVPLSYVLNSIERKTHFLQLVNKEECIVKVMDSRTLYNQEKNQKKSKSVKKSRESKELQMTWAVEENDLSHKLKDARRYLQKGHSVEVILAPKRNTRIPPPDERQRRVDQILEPLQEHAQEYKERTFKAGVLTVYLKSRNTDT